MSGEVIDFIQFVDKLRGKNRILEHATKIKAKRDVELEQELNVEIAKLHEYLSVKYPWCRFKIEVTYSRHLEELDNRKTLKYFRATEKYPLPLLKMHDLISANIWFNKFKFDMWVGKYFEARKTIIESYVEQLIERDKRVFELHTNHRIISVD